MASPRQAARQAIRRTAAGRERGADGPSH